MSIITVDAAGVVAVQNGVAYAAIAGGATGYIADEYKQYTGGNIHLYISMLASRAVEPWKIVALLATRAAVDAAAANHAAELGGLVAGAGAGGALQVNAAEQIGDADVIRLMNYARIAPAEWGDAAAPAPLVTAFAPVNLSPALTTALRKPDMVQWAIMCARITYTIIAVNGYGLITSAHHYRGQAARAAKRTMEMYDMISFVKEMGATVSEVASFLFHDCLHYLHYESVARLVNANIAAFTAKVASTVLKRLPAFPGGVVFVARAIVCRRLVLAHEGLGAIALAITNSNKDNALLALHAAILVAPLDYNGQFRPVQLAGNTAAINNVVSYCVALFGAYDAVVPRSNDEDNKGPTGGPGVRKMIEENMAVYQNAVMHAKGVAAAVVFLPTANYFATISA